MQPSSQRTEKSTLPLHDLVSLLLTVSDCLVNRLVERLLKKGTPKTQSFLAIRAAQRKMIISHCSPHRNERAASVGLHDEERKDCAYNPGRYNYG